MVSFDDVTKELLMWDLDIGWEEGQPVPVKHPGVPVAYGDEEPLREECLHFLDCVEHRKTPRTDGLNGLAVLELLHASQRSMTTNGMPVATSVGNLQEPTAAIAHARSRSV